MFERFSDRFDKLSPMSQSYLFAGGILGAFTLGCVGIGMAYEMVQEHPVGSAISLAGAATLSKWYQFHRQPHVRRGISSLDGSHDNYDDPLDTRLFEGYCQQVTSDIVWINDKIAGSGVSDKISVE